MSYRHSSYRKLKRGQSSTQGPTRNDKNRVRAWLGMKSLPRPEGWGVPKRKRAPQL